MAAYTGEPQKIELTEEQRKESEKQLSEYEKLVNAARWSFVAMIDALDHIENDKPFGMALWKFSAANSMKEYVANRFDINGPNWSRYQNARTVIKTLRAAGIEPKETNEGQCRAAFDYYKKHGAEMLVSLWKELTSSGTRMTAAAIDEKTGKDKPAPPKTASGLLKAVRFLAKSRPKKDTGKTYLSAVAECGADDQKALVTATACTAKTSKDSGTFEFTFGNEDVDHVFNKVGDWAMKHEGVKAVSLNFVRTAAE